MNDELAGHLEDQHALPDLILDVEFNDYIHSIVNAYNQEFPIYMDGYRPLTSPVPLHLHKLWVNHQSKHEFNPPHDHGGLYSFVIWVTIPYDLKTEKALYRDGTGQASQFVFSFTDPLGSIRHVPLPVDKSWEWEMVLFPAGMHHFVNPFYTSDEQRVSISGNLSLDTVGVTAGKLSTV